MYKLVSVLLLVLLTALPVSAQPATWVCPEGFSGQTLSVYNWSTYVAEDTISNFEAACGVRVIYDVFGSNEELFSRLSQGNPGYDIIVPTDYMVTTMIDAGLLEPLNLDNIPNFVNLSADMIDQPFDPGNKYSIPYQWGTVGFGYDIDKTGMEITSWAEFFAYPGSVVWLDDRRGMMGAALNLLGYDPNSTDPGEIAQARDYLVERGSNVVALAANDGQVYLERGDAALVYEYSGDIFQVQADCECDNIRYNIPEEGSQLWIDNLAIPVGAPNKALAEVFIDYILDPQVGADISNYTAFGTPNQAALDLGLIDEELLNNPGIYPPDEVRANLFIVQSLGDAEQLYNDAWDELRILLGR